MKRISSYFLFVLSSLFSRAQDPQGQKQLKYYLSQIAALQVYIGYVEKGYSIAKEGLIAIEDIKKGDFDLHKDYFSSLASVSPAVKKYARVADIALLALRISELIKKQTGDLGSSTMISKNELSYIGNVFTTVLTDCTEIITELTVITTDRDTKMKTDERLSRIDGLYQRMMDIYAFTSHFTDQNAVLVLQRTHETYNVSKLNELYHLN